MIRARKYSILKERRPARFQQQRHCGKPASGSFLGKRFVRAGEEGVHRHPFPTRRLLRPTGSSPTARASARRKDSHAHTGTARRSTSGSAPPLRSLTRPTVSGNPPPPLWFAACGESAELGNYLELHRAAITPDTRNFPFPGPAVGRRRNVKYRKI